MIGRRSLLPAVVAGVVVLLAACGGGGDTSPSPAPSITVSESTVASPSVEPTATSTLKPDEQENVEAAVQQYRDFQLTLDRMLVSGAPDEMVAKTLELVLPESPAENIVLQLAKIYQDENLRGTGQVEIISVDPVDVDIHGQRIVLASCLDASKTTIGPVDGEQVPSAVPFQSLDVTLDYQSGSWKVSDLETEDVDSC